MPSISLLGLQSGLLFLLLCSSIKAQEPVKVPFEL